MVRECVRSINWISHLKQLSDIEYSSLDLLKWPQTRERETIKKRNNLKSLSENTKLDLFVIESTSEIDSRPPIPIVIVVIDDEFRRLIIILTFYVWSLCLFFCLLDD